MMMISSGRITLPKGFRFQPSDEELLSHYLEKKNYQSKDPQIEAIIPEINVCDHEPRDLPALVFKRAEFLDKEWFTMADSPDMERYFFSPLVFKNSTSKSKSKGKGKGKSTQINRATKEGSWKKQGGDKRITRPYSDKQIGGKRILTFYLRDKQRTDWVIHEYYLTKANSDEQVGDFVLCRLKNKSGKSDHDQQDDPLCDGGEPNSGSCSMVSNVEHQGSKELGTVLPISNINDDEAERGGGSCSMAFNVENQPSKQLENVLPIPNRSDGDTEHGGGSCHIASGFENEAAEFGLLTEEEINQTFKELIDAVREYDGNEQEVRGSQTDFCYIDQNDHWISVEDQPADSCISSDSIVVEKPLDEPGNLALHRHPLPPPNMVEKPLDEPRNLALPLHPPPPPNMFEKPLDEPGNLGLPLHPPPSPQLQSPIYTKLGTTNVQNDESRKRKYSFGDNDSFLTKKNHIDEVDSNSSSNSENQAADAIPEGYSQPGENLESESFQSQELPSINRVPGDFPHDNNLIEWGKFSPITEGFDSSLEFSDTFIDCYPCD
ncbi:NAC domain-containing protein 14-like isoform X1 [Rosa chinensis]|nr:NAC domain-containing protein 14-like isoform X1 [Rosa chinensis]XP_040373769.1 NAC domain-containing protein 14-like isoform X1 [Rosa chinensis]